MNFISLAALVFVLILLLFAILASFFLLYAVVIGHAMGAPYVRSKKEKIARMVARAGLQAQDVAVDLGSGDGSVVIAAARACREAIGVEMNPLLVWYSRMQIRRAGLSGRARIVRADFRQFPLGGVDVVFLYLWPSTLAALRQKLVKELKPGSRIISNAFKIEGWQPAHAADGIFLYSNYSLWKEKSN